MGLDWSIILLANKGRHRAWRHNNTRICYFSGLLKKQGKHGFPQLELIEEVLYMLLSTLQENFGLLWCLGIKELGF
jgi:hypothetical protein